MSDINSRLIEDPNKIESHYRCQYAIAGTGPGGSLAGAELAAAGKDVLFLEEGPYCPSSRQTSNLSDMLLNLYRGRGVTPIFGRPSIAYAEGRCVGGATVINGGLFWRTPSWVLQDWQTKHGLHGFDEQSLRPHFEEIEKKLHVVREVKDPPFNMDSLILANAADALKWKYVMAPRAVKDCKRLNFCPTGCPSGAKQSMAETYIPEALTNGARLLCHIKAVRIETEGSRAVRILAETQDSRKKKVTIDCDHLILAAGAVHTPHLLQRSGMSRWAGHKMEFHVNIKMLASFPQVIQADKGTIFTTQVQEFEREGMLFMASTMTPHYASFTLSQYDNRAINQMIEGFPHYGLFTAIVRTRSLAHVRSMGAHPFTWYNYSDQDTGLLKKSTQRLAQLLFACGAKEIFLPLQGVAPCRSLAQVEKVLASIKPAQFELVSVHAMASCPMGGESVLRRVADENGRLIGTSNIHIVDSSVLPSNIGESPQGTIMAFSKEIIQRHLSTK